MEKLGIDGKLLIAQLINFTLFFYIFKKFIATPFSEFLKSETEKEKEKERILENIKKKEEAIVFEEKKLKEKIKREYEQALKAAKEEAKTLKEKLIAQAKAEADEIIAKGKRQIEEEKEMMNRQMKKRMVDLSFLIVEKVLNQFLNQETQKKINQQILKNLQKN